MSIHALQTVTRLFTPRLRKFMGRASCIVIVVSMIMLATGCKKVVDKTSPAEPAAGVAWIGESRPEYISYALNLNVRLAAIFEYNGTRTPDIDNWINFLKTAQRMGVKLRICPIPVSDAPYLDARHAARQLSIVSNFMQILNSEGIKPGEIILDIEGNNPDLYCRSLIQFACGSVAARDTLVANALSQAGQDSAIALYQAFVDQQHATGWKVGATTLNQIAIDRGDGDNDLERALGIPITGVNWDFVTYQAYRTSTYPVFTSLYEPLPGAWFVYRFAAMAKQIYGDRGGVDIGIMGVNQSWGYYAFADWQADVDATHAAGLNPDLVAGFRLETAFTPIPADSTLWFAQLEKSGPPAPPVNDQVSDVYIQVYDSADARLGQYMPR